MTLRYLSVCSGIEAATVAWHPLGWQPFGFADIEPFPSAVLAHHYGSNLPGERWSGNAPPNFGDMTKFEEWPDAAINVLVGGTPCQDFSVAGLRAGLHGERGQLSLVYAQIARRYRPRWLAWENVPGVLSSNAGRDFASILGLLAGKSVTPPLDGWSNAGVVECERGAYGLAWRVLDAQYIRVDGYARAVPQRRRRVFVVGYSGDWRRAAAVLFERESLCGHPAPRREAGQIAAPTISARTQGGGGLGTDFDLDGGLIAGTLDASLGRSRGAGTPLAALVASSGDVSHCLNAGGMGRIDYESETLIVAPDVAASLTRGAESAGKGGYAGRRQEDDTNIVASAHAIQAGALRENPDSGPDGVGVQADVAYTLEARAEVQAVQCDWTVRRLMPIECERLQGFPDGYTLIPLRGKPAADGPRYKALGNSMAVNVMRWIGQRIDLVDKIEAA